MDLGLLEYIPFPDALRGKYQCHTQADLSALRAAGCDHAFADVATGVAKYMAVPVIGRLTVAALWSGTLHHHHHRR